MIHVPRSRVRHGAVPRHVRNPDLKVLGLSLSLSPPLYGLRGGGALYDAYKTLFRAPLSKL